jgi:hypothetical protein
MDVKQCGIGAAAFLALSFSAAPGIAQVCVGVPLNVGQTSLALHADFPDGGNLFGVRAANHFTGPLTVGATFEAAVPEGDGDNRYFVGADGAFELPITALTDAGLGVCGIAGILVGLDDSPRVITVPVGVAVGGNFEVSDGIAVNPYAVPHLQWQRVSPEVGDSFSETDFGLEGGANLIVSNLFFGVRLGKIFRGDDGDSDALFGVQAGIVF